jgi:hypothetical protein
MIFLGITKSSKLRGDNLKQLKEAALITRNEIEKKLKDTKIIDQELAQIISDTKQLTTAINQKISTRLKITNKTLKSICHSLQDGVIIVDNKGLIVEANASFEKLFLVNKAEILGANLKELCARLDALKDGCKFELVDFNVISTIALEHSISRKNKECSKNCGPCTKNCDVSAMVNLNVGLEVHPAGAKSFICDVAITALDNDPEKLEDVNFILFFKCQEAPKRERRKSTRANSSRLDQQAHQVAL